VGARREEVEEGAAQLVGAPRWHRNQGTAHLTAPIAPTSRRPPDRGKLGRAAALW